MNSQLSRGNIGKCSGFFFRGKWRRVLIGRENRVVRKIGRAQVGNFGGRNFMRRFCRTCHVIVIMQIGNWLREYTEE